MIMKKAIFGLTLLLLILSPVIGDDNLLQNPQFDFHAFDPHRSGKAGSFRSHNVAFWNTDAWGDIEVIRESHVDAKIRPSFTTHNLVKIEPGKKMWQFFTLPEAGLAHGEKLSLSVQGNQSKGAALELRLQLMKLDSEDGTWSPVDFGSTDKRTFPKHSRGELVVRHPQNQGNWESGHREQPQGRISERDWFSTQASPPREESVRVAGKP